MRGEIFAGLDIGSTKIACIIADIGDDGTLRITGVGTCPSHGYLRKGDVVDVGNTIRAIKVAVEQAETMAGVDIESVWVGITGEHITSRTSTGTALINQEVMAADIERVIESAKGIDIPSDQELLHVIPQGYDIDQHKDLKNPLGMSGVRLETKVNIITAQATSVQNIVKCVEDAGLKLSKLVLEPLASSYAVLDKDEKELGVALVDIGGGTTDIAVYVDGSIRHVAIIGCGGDNVTYDLSYLLRCSLEQAEELKKKEGCAYRPLLAARSESIKIPGRGGREDMDVGLDVFVGVIEARVEEILSIALWHLRQTQYFDSLGAGVVLTGGGAMIKGMREKAENIFQKPVRIGYPGGFGGLAEAVKQPMYSTGVGLCMFAAESCAGDTKDKSKPAGGRVGERIKSWFGQIGKYF